MKYEEVEDKIANPYTKKIANLTTYGSKMWLNAVKSHGIRNPQWIF